MFFYLFSTNSVICNAHSVLYPLLFPNLAIMFHVMHKWVTSYEGFCDAETFSKSINQSFCMSVS